MPDCLVVGLDPGTTESAYVMYDGKAILDMAIMANELLLESFGQLWTVSQPMVLAVEEFEAFGMAVGKEVFRTVLWSGRFIDRWETVQGCQVAMVTRRAVKLHICHSSRATDANIRTQLLDLFGGKEAAVGTKKAPGPLHGVKSHLWSALALAVTHYDQLKGAEP